MAAYGALVSVMHIVDQVQTHPFPPISIHQKQAESLTEAVSSLQHFLEGYSPRGGYTDEEDFWESRIAEAAYDAEDVIESYIVDRIRARSEIDVEQHTSSADFYQGLQMVIANMNSIKIEIKEKMVLQDQNHSIKSARSAAAGSSRSTSTPQNATMIGFDDVLLRMLDKVAGGEPDLQILPIVGMGGIGKTTLARNIFSSPLVQEHFDVRAWTTISHEYNSREILRQVLDQVMEEKWEDLSEDDLGLHLYQSLIGRRYFVVMDDMWNIEAWDRVRRFFPDNRNGSRIVVTTRLSNLASLFNYANGLEMQFLDEDASWDLFSNTVFGKESCPLELEVIGKKIVRGCRGLPLSIAVIGGLLSKSNRTKENWEVIEKDLSSVVNLEGNESCLQVLYMSYNNLPVHLKPCFLYMGSYGEDEVIPISRLIPVLVAEGFLKPINGKGLEVVAEEYVEELVDRNLLIVEKRNYCGKLKSFKLHDLLRDLCLREAQKLKFLCVLGEQSIPQGINSQRRILSTLSDHPTPLLPSLESASLVRSFITTGECEKSLLHNFRLLRLSCFGDDEDIVDKLVNLRLLNLAKLPENPSLFSFLWNLQTLYLHCYDEDHHVFDIWKMPQLRHVIISHSGRRPGEYRLPDPLSDEEDMVLENLQTLHEVGSLKFSEEVLKRIPNVVKMKLYYFDTTGEEDDYLLNDLCSLHKLETLRIHCSYHGELVREVSFPRSLKKLTLRRTCLPWEDMTKIGLLPFLQALKLEKNAFGGSEWETFEGQFSNLKSLSIHACYLECWITDNAHFPRLEHLVLSYLSYLGEIPSSIGDIPTLQSIEVMQCTDSVVDSAERIKEEQQELGNENLRIILQ
ncbi:putative late blight resistance protein R1B-16 isoform X1 [Salvia divinorum]|uniref:Late blight resistance protein R1B-16 isoform X1 n=2 Tax=Salvia divinorum TaxID=28513 RepID=A0ABD1H5H1_SALDI